MRLHCWPLAYLGIVLAVLHEMWASSPAAEPAPGAAGGDPARRKEIAFVKTAEGVFDFQTDAIEGTIRLDGVYHGVTRLVDCRTGRQFIDPRYSALNLFKLMAVDQAMDMPRTMERTVQVSSHWLELKWAATDAHQGQLTARYEIREPNSVDLTITIRSRGTYPAYEVFVSSYFDKALEPHVYLQPSPRGPATTEAQPVMPTYNDVFRGAVLVFPRDAHAARRCLDGRWDRSERGTPTVQMCPVRRYAHCLALLTDPEKRIGVALMSSPRHCYAISTRYHADEEKQRLTDYSALDFSLFGDDLLPGDERTARLRLAVVPLDRDLSQPLALYRAFLSEMKEGGPR